MENHFSRTGLLLGEKALQILASSRVAIFGIGGVGGYVTEALARCGIGAFDLIDRDTISESNINRQIIATHNTIGQNKTEAMKERILAINPNAKVELHTCFYLPEIHEEFDFTKYDYVVDAVDTVTAKLDIIMQAQATHTPVISCMGTGNKLNPALFEVSDIYKTSVCPLARIMRHELKKRNVKQLKVVYSKEPPISVEAQDRPISEASNRPVPGSVSFVPPVAGLILAGEVIKDLIHLSETIPS